MALVFLPILLLAGLPGLNTSPENTSLLNQEAAATASSAPAPAKPFVPPTLKVALENAAWDASQRGPLLIIAPDVLISKPLWSVRQEEMRKNGARPADLKPPFPAPANNGEYRVPELAEFYGRRMVRLNGITVLAPETMVVLNDNPDKPDIYAGMRQDQKIQMFQATLTDGQWGMLGSSGGLGIGDLQGEQRDLFLAILPDPFTVMRGTAMPNGGMRYGGGDGQGPVKLVGNERLGIRLRLNRTITMALFQQGGTRTSGQVSGRQEGQEVLTLNTWEMNRSENEKKTYGQVLRSVVPTRLKPQQIDFEASSLNARVAMSGAKTVGDLVERIRTATRVDLYVDPRLAKQPVWLRATDENSLRAGDLLRALCWGMAGAVRYIEEGRVFVLTDDIVGWGTRVARVQAWMSRGEALQQRQQQKYADAIRERKPLQHLTFDEKDPMAVKPDRMAEIEGKWKTYMGRYEGVTVPLEKLTPDQQELTRSAAAAHNTQFTASQQAPSEWNRPVDASRVRMTMQVRQVFSVPGVGDVEDSNGSWGILDSMLPKPDITSTIAQDAAALKKSILLPAPSSVGGVLKVAPRDASEAKAAVRAARERGFRQVWVAVPPPSFDAKTGASAASDTTGLPDFTLAAREGKTLLAAAIEEAGADTKKPISILASVSLLRVTPLPRTAEPQPGCLDRNLLGETAAEVVRRQAETAALRGQEAYAQLLMNDAKDWLLPDSPLLATRLKRHLREIAAVPGLAGLTLTDTAAPGYDTSSADSDLYFAGGDTQMGYIPSYRAAFLKTSGYDPIDIAPRSYGELDLAHPLFGSSQPSYSPEGTPVADDRVAVGGKWNKARFLRATSLLTELYSDLEADKKLLRQVPKPPTQATSLTRNDKTSLTGQFALYVRMPSDPYGSYLLWDKKETIQSEQPRRTYDANANYEQASFNALRTASSQCLYYYNFVDPERYQPADQPKVTKTPVERAELFAQMFNRTLGYRKGNWDGFIVDLSQENLEATLPLLSAVVVEPAPRTAGRKSRPGR